jgi:hypothetical protein
MFIPEQKQSRPHSDWASLGPIKMPRAAAEAFNDQLCGNWMTSVSPLRFTLATALAPAAPKRKRKNP